MNFFFIPPEQGIGLIKAIVLIDVQSILKWHIVVPQNNIPRDFIGHRQNFFRATVKRMSMLIVHLIGKKVKGYSFTAKVKSPGHGRFNKSVGIGMFQPVVKHTGGDSYVKFFSDRQLKEIPGYEVNALTLITLLPLSKEHRYQIEPEKKRELDRILAVAQKDEALAKSQVIIIPKAAALFFNRSREMVRDWVAKGGRIMLLHDSVGYRRLKSYFPEIGEAVMNPKTHEAVVVKEHPVTAGFKTGQQLKHAYTDHIGMKPGPQGEMLLKDERDLAVVVVGKVGKGKVVLNGMITGYASLAPGNYDGKEAAPEGDELRIFLNAVKWLADEGKQ